MSGKKGGDATNYAVAAQYNLDKDAFYKARLLDSGEAAFSYTQVCESNLVSLLIVTELRHLLLLSSTLYLCRRCLQTQFFGRHVFRRNGK
jgi:hypothetical protein